MCIFLQFIYFLIWYADVLSYHIPVYKEGECLPNFDWLVCFHWLLDQYRLEQHKGYVVCQNCKANSTDNGNNVKKLFIIGL